MPNLADRSADNPDFARVLDVARLRERQVFDFDITPVPAERAALARLMGARDLRKLRLDGRLEAAPRGAWTLEAQLAATVIQTCVVSLEPVTTRIDQTVHRRFEPGGARGGAEVTLLPGDEDDEVEPLGATIDLGLVAIEALALALPAYPRRDGATLARHAARAPGTAPLDEVAVRPFAGLAALRDKLGSGS